MKNILDSLIIFGAKYLLFVIIALVCLYFLRQGKQRRKEILIFGAITLPIAFIIARISSHFFYNARPFVEGNFSPLIAHDADNGFPSDHTLLASTVAMVIFYFNKKVGWILLLLALLVGFSRVLAGVHHLIDIAGSIIIAAVVAIITHKYFNKILEKI